MTSQKFKIFIDFDGTITKEDVGESIFRSFGDKVKVEKIITDLLSNTISAKQSWIELCNSVGVIDLNLLNDFIFKMEVDPWFRTLVEF